MKFYLKEAREETEMSQAELARKSGISRTIISEIESGKKTDCTTKTLAALADALGVSVVALLLR